MKNIVVSDEYSKVDFKPSRLFNEYKNKLVDDVKRFLIQDKPLKKVDCPGCQSAKINASFPKFELTYNECKDCGTLYISPRPPDPALNDFFRKSEARAFWNQKLYQTTKVKREEKIIKPRFEWIMDSAQEYCPKAACMVDVNANQHGYIRQMAEADFRRKILLDPLVPLNGSQMNAVEVILTPWWEAKLQAQADVISLFEVLDRTGDIQGLMTKVDEMLKPGGLCFITAILISGFDLQVLWDQAEHLYPPDRLNAFSVKGLRGLFDRFDFECLEISTPGILDVEIVRAAVGFQPNLKPLPRFVEHLLNQGPEIQKNFQEFLQANLLSSYGRILVRKKG